MPLANLGVRPRGVFPYPLHRAVWNGRTRHRSTFQQMLRRKMLYDRQELLKVFADKVEVRSYVRDHLGDGFLVPRFGVFNHADEVPWNDLPRDVVLKCTHRSGGVLAIDELGQEAASLPRSGARTTPSVVRVHRSQLVVADARRFLEFHRRRSYGWGWGRYEWCYRGLQKRILAEAFVGDGDGPAPTRQLFCLGGRVLFIRSTFADGRRTSHLPDWTPTPLTFVGKLVTMVWEPRSIHLDAMLRAAETLSADTDFVRVDLSDTADGPLLSELTNYPHGGRLDLEPLDESQRIASAWRELPLRYADGVRRGS